MTEVLPARLFTVFGTVVYFDMASGRLVHGLVNGSPANAYLFPVDGPNAPDLRVRLMLVNGSPKHVLCGEDKVLSVAREKPGAQLANFLTFDVVSLERGLFALRSEQAFLQAIPNGEIRLAASACSTWELFIASEDWCANIAPKGGGVVWREYGTEFDTRRIQSHVVHPTTRARAKTKPIACKLLIFGYTKWSHGRVYYDLCRHLHRLGYIVDILDWQANHASHISEILPYYDLFMTALDGVSILADMYRVPYDKMIAVSHHELDIRMLIEQKGMEVFDKFANYGVVSEFVYCASQMRGVPRVPMVASLGVNCSEFQADIAERLRTVGYASSMSVKTYGIEWKRGELAEAAARDAGLAFKVAGSTGNQTSFLDMPSFYKSVDAVVNSSISEAAQLPVMEAAAAGRLVIGTAVGHFPLKAYQGGGILAPIESRKFREFTAATLRYYKDNPAAYVEKCASIQLAARKFDWEYTICEWVDLIEGARSPGDRGTNSMRVR